MRKILLSFILCICVTFVAPQIIFANNDLNIVVKQIDSSEYPKIKLYCEIKDSITGKTIENISRNNFRITETNVATGKKTERDIMKGRRMDFAEKLNIELVADISGSMSGYPLETAKNCLNSFIDQIQFEYGDTVEFITFENQAKLQIPFTSNRSDLKDAINSCTANGGTAFYDGLYLAISRIQGEKGAKCVIAFTDGEENSSTHTLDEVIQFANKSSVHIFIVSIGGSSSSLQEIATKTNGFYTSTDDIGDLQQIYDTVYSDEKDLYVVEYEADENDNIDDPRIVDLTCNYSNETTMTSYPFVPYVSEYDTSGKRLKIQKKDVKNQTADGYYDYLKTLLINEQISSQNPLSDTTVKDLTNYIANILRIVNITDIKAVDNTVSINSEIIKPSFKNIESENNRYIDILSNHGIITNRGIPLTLQFNVTDYDLSKPVDLVLNKDIYDILIGGIASFRINFGEDYSIEIDTSDFDEIIDNNSTLTIRFEKRTSNRFKISYLDTKDKLISTINSGVKFILKSDAEENVIYKGSLNWGGMYDSNEENLIFKTPYSSEYELRKDPHKITSVELTPYTTREKKILNFMTTRDYLKLSPRYEFESDSNISRYEFATMIVKMNYVLNTDAKTSFVDVPTSTYYYPYVASAEKYKLVNGYGDGFFHGEYDITKEQLIALCGRVLVDKKHYNLADCSTYLRYVDNDEISDWARPYIAVVSKAGLIDSTGALNPKSYITRYEASMILYELLEIVNEIN